MRTSQMVFLRQVYCKDCHVSLNPIYDIKRKLLDLMLLGTRNTRELRRPKEVKESVGDQNRGKTESGVYPAVDKIKPESTVIQVEAKRLIQVIVSYFKPLEKRSARYASTSLSELGTPSSRSSRSGDHCRSRRDSPEYDRREGRVVSRKYSDDRDHQDRSEPSPRHGRYEFKENSWTLKVESLGENSSK
nr:protein root primordium defective 1 [Tanacetum cinerariifolium]